MSRNQGRESNLSGKNHPSKNETSLFMNDLTLKIGEREKLEQGKM